MQQNYSSFFERISQLPPLISDGAMGTMLHQRKIASNTCYDELNLSQPGIVADIHREYIEAGSQIIQTNTFGANRYKLTKYGLGNQLEAINQAGVELARRVILASFKPVFIAGNVGPLGVRLAPFGRVQLDEARKAYREQIKALVDAGVDLLIIETLTDLYEVREAVLAAREISSDLPVIASMTYTRDDRTLLGDSPEKVAREIHLAGANIIGANCAGGPHQLLRILRLMRQAIPNGNFSIMPNAGWPEQVGGRIMYAATPEYFGEYALKLWQAGANIIGGCCGTTPLHIAAMANAINNNSRVEIENIQSIRVNDEAISSQPENPTLLSQKLSAKQFVVAVEMDPPRGVSVQKLIAGASLLADSGADVINVADSPMARMRMSPWAVCDLIQKKIGIETVLHFPTRGRNLLRVQGDLLAAHAIGVRNIFVVMGDPTAIGDYPNAMDQYDLVPTGLIKLIKQGFNTGIDHAGSDIGQPTSFFVGGALNLNPPDFSKELKTLKKKLEAGIDFFLTQPVYQVEVIKSFLEKCQNELGELKIPILLGVLPLASSRHARFLHQEVPGIIIPENIHQRMEKAGPEGARVGIQICIELIEEARDLVQGVYIMPAFNRFDYVSEVIEKVKKS